MPLAQGLERQNISKDIERPNCCHLHALTCGTYIFCFLFFNFYPYLRNLIHQKLKPLCQTLMMQRSETFPCFGEYLVKISQYFTPQKFYIRALIHTQKDKISNRSFVKREKDFQGQC